MGAEIIKQHGKDTKAYGPSAGNQDNQVTQARCFHVHKTLAAFGFQGVIIDP
jgi:hypothetical protein